MSRTLVGPISAILIAASFALSTSSLAQATKPDYITEKLTPPKDDPSVGTRALSIADYDSKWRADDNATHHPFPVDHNLGVTPRLVTLEFSPGGDSSIVYPVISNWHAEWSGNPVTIEVTTEKIILHISKDGPLRGVWDSRNVTWRRYGVGYWRIRAWK